MRKRQVKKNRKKGEERICKSFNVPIKLLHDLETYTIYRGRVININQASKRLMETMEFKPENIIHIFDEMEKNKGTGEGE